jgi:hypothetical protein
MAIEAADKTLNDRMMVRRALRLCDGLPEVSVPESL